MTGRLKCRFLCQEFSCQKCFEKKLRNRAAGFWIDAQVQLLVVFNVKRKIHLGESRQTTYPTYLICVRHDLGQKQ